MASYSYRCAFATAFEISMKPGKQTEKMWNKIFVIQERGELGGADVQLHRHLSGVKLHIFSFVVLVMFAHFFLLLFFHSRLVSCFRSKAHKQPLEEIYFDCK